MDLPLLPLRRVVYLASIQDCVYCRHVRFVVDHATIHLDPGMRLEWQLLRPDYHLGEYAVALEEATRRCRALQAKRFFPVPDTSHIDCGTDAFYRAGSRRRLSHRTVANLVVECREITSRQVEIELNQPQVRPQDKKRHGAHLIQTVTRSWRREILVPAQAITPGSCSSTR